MSRYFAFLMLPVLLGSACSDDADQGESVEGLPGSTRSAAIGTACETGLDCSTTLECHVDPVQHIADGQCTAPCHASEDCRTFGAHTMCIGARICVATCADDTDCPARTRCGDAGWCERTGPGSGRQSCSGMPTPCAMLPSAQCSTVDGCRDTSSCSGTSFDCSSLTDIKSCVVQQGCDWSFSTNTCGGAAEACSALQYDFECRDQRGCTWTSACSGTGSPDCSSKSPALCDLTPGCALTGP